MEGREVNNTWEDYLKYIFVIESQKEVQKEEADEAEELAELRDVVERLLAQSKTEPEIRRLPLEQIEPMFGDCPSFQRLKG